MLNVEARLSGPLSHYSNSQSVSGQDLDIIFGFLRRWIFWNRNQNKDQIKIVTAISKKPDTEFIYTELATNWLISNFNWIVCASVFWEMLRSTWSFKCIVLLYFTTLCGSLLYNLGTQWLHTLTAHTKIVHTLSVHTDCTHWLCAHCTHTDCTHTYRAPIDCTHTDCVHIDHTHWLCTHRQLTHWMYSHWPPYLLHYKSILLVTHFKMPEQLKPALQTE